jgi:diaminopimelate decarboxylase
VAALRLPAGLAAAAARSETPFYFYDESALARASSQWRRAARPAAKIFYPYKCNRHPPVLDRFAADGIGAEINVPADLPRAIARGIDRDRLLVHGPAKAEGFIDAAIAAGATLIADGLEDAEAIFGRCRALGRPTPYLFRIRSVEARAGQRAFGMKPSEVRTLVERARRNGHPPPSGLAFHLGTGLPGAGPFLRSVRSLAPIVSFLRDAGAPVKILDVGGGFSTSAESRFDDLGRPAGRLTEPGKRA